MNQNATTGYASRFFILIGLFGAFLVISAIVTAILGSVLLHAPLTDVVNALNDPANAGTSRLLNTVAAFISFFIPALILARIVSRHPFRQLGFSTAMSTKQLLLIFVITIGSMVLSGALGELNEKIPLSPQLMEKAKKMEELYKQAMLAMATMRSFPEYLVALLVIAAAPAIFEEIFFRGALQQVMVGWTKSKWAGIIITSILFSAFHFSYFGFLARAGLGVALGLVFHNSRNIWLNILVHFLNNAIIVTQLYIVSLQGKSIEKTMDESMPVWWGLIAIAILVVAFRPFNKESKAVLAKTAPIPEEPENPLL